MPDDATKKPIESNKPDQAGNKIEELPEKSIADRDAQSVKGGVGARHTGGDESPVES